MPDAKQRLKPCPFCDTPPTGPFKVYIFGGSSERDGYNFQMCVECSCGARIAKESRRDKSGWCNDNGHAERAVVRAWNMRAVPEIPENPT